jgi:hypothetical protein
LCQQRCYSTDKFSKLNTGDNKIIKFEDADSQKMEILEISKDKSGIYMWVNKINGKKYVGSSTNLRRRFLQYYNVNRLMTNNMAINTALLKHGYHSFELIILEFCLIDNLMEKEQYYFDVYLPEYNILKTPGSPSRGSGWKHSEAGIENMRKAANERNKSNEYLAKLSKSNANSVRVEVTDLITNTKTIYYSIRGAAKALNIDHRKISNYVYLKQVNPVLDRYTFNFLDGESINMKPKKQITSKSLKVVNINTNEITVYPSITLAAKVLGLRQASISLYLKDNRTKPFKGLYLFELVNEKE